MARPSKPWYHTRLDRWCCTIAGEQVMLAQGRAAKAAATAEFHRLMAARGTPRQRSRLTAGDLFDLFLDAVDRRVQRGEGSRLTYDGYVRFLSSADAAFGTVRASEVAPLAVTRWAEARRPRPWNATTRFNGITAVKAAFAWATEQGHLDRDPIAAMPRPAPRKRTAVLGEADLARVLAATAGTPFGDLLIALRQTGCRPIEVAGLTADRVDLERGLWFVANKTRASTGRPHRVVALTPATIVLSRRLVAGKGPGDLVFLNRCGRPWHRNAMASGFARLRKRLGLGPEATAYAIRHRFGREGLRRGLDSSDVAALMGHSSAKMVDSVYGGWDEQLDRLRAGAARVRPAEDDG